MPYVISPFPTKGSFNRIFYKVLIYGVVVSGEGAEKQKNKKIKIMFSSIMI